MQRELRTQHDLAGLAARQYGVVTGEQLNELGYSGTAVKRAVAAGRLHALHRSVFAVGHQGLSPHGLCMAAVLFRSHGALISHRSAVWLWGMEPKLEIPVHVSVRWRGHNQDAIGLHHCPALRVEDISKTERLPVTGVARTLLDYASEAKPLRLERAIDRADRLDLLDLAAIDRITEEIRGHRGRARLLQAMTIYREKGFTRSGGEKRMLAALADVGVDRPLVNNFIESYDSTSTGRGSGWWSNSTAGSTIVRVGHSRKTAIARRDCRWPGSRRSESPAAASDANPERWRCASAHISNGAVRPEPPDEFAEKAG